MAGKDPIDSRAPRRPELKEAATSYRRGLSFVDEAFARGKASLGDSVPCRRGCSSCCAAVFDVHPADALLLGIWLDDCPPGDRHEVLQAARDVLETVRRAAAELSATDESLKDWSPENGFRMLPAASVTRLAAAVSSPCPVLGEAGECRAHESRPALCRLQGLSFHQPGGGASIQDFCRLEPAQEHNPSQPLDLARLDAERHEAQETVKSLETAGRLPEGRTFVAEALVRWAGDES